MSRGNKGQPPDFSTRRTGKLLQGYMLDVPELVRSFRSPNLYIMFVDFSGDVKDPFIQKIMLDINFLSDSKFEGTMQKMHVIQHNLELQAVARFLAYTETFEFVGLWLLEWLLVR